MADQEVLIPDDGLTDALFPAMSTVGFWIFSEALIFKVTMLPTLAIVALSLLERMVRLDSVGAVVSILKAVSYTHLTLPPICSV